MEAGARTIIEECMAVAADETVLVVSDVRRREVGSAIRRAAADVAADVAYAELPADDEHGSEPPAPVAAAMANSDVVVAATTRSISHTRARVDACDDGARMASLPGVTPEMLAGAVRTDYDAIADRARAVLDRVADAETLRVTAPAGTDLTLTVADHRWLPETGTCQRAGKLTNLPAGELAVVPSSGDGRVVFDASMAGVGRLDEPIRVDFTDGRATDISRPGLADRVDDAGACGRNLAEFGIGLNAAADVVGNPLQDEKALGTVHVALGADAPLGGDVDCPVHLDGVVQEPTIEADGEAVEVPT